MIFPEPHEHDFPVGIDIGVRRCPDLGEGLDRIAMDFRDATYGVAGREHATQARGDELVAGLNVSVAGQIRQA